jgi:hypothetical protein
MESHSLRPLRLWQTLSRIPSGKAPRRLWQAELSEHWDLCQPLLTVTSELATWTLASDGVSACEVVSHDDGTLVAIDRIQGESFEVERSSQIVLKLNLRSLANRLIELLGGRPDYDQSEIVPGVFRLGRLDARFAASSIYLCMRDDNHSILNAATSLSVKLHNQIVLVPTLRRYRLNQDELAERYGAIFASLDELVVECNGSLVCNQNAIKQIRYRLGIIESSRSDNEFRLVGENYEIRFQGKQFSLSDSVGLWYLREFLSHPGKSFDPVELETARTGVRARSSNSPMGEAFDEDARRQYAKQLADLDEDLAEAESFVDLGRIEQLQTQRQMILDHVSKNIRLGGKARIVTDTGKARKNIRQQVKRDIDRISKASSALTDHLADAFSGDPLCYSPTSEIFWQF